MSDQYYQDPEQYSLVELSEYFHLPIAKVTKEMGICATALKKICRNNGVNRWPYRKIKSLDALIKKTIRLSGEDSAEVLELQMKRKNLLMNPNMEYQSIISKKYVNSLRNAQKPTKPISKPKRTKSPSKFDSLIDHCESQSNQIDASFISKHFSLTQSEGRAALGLFLLQSSLSSDEEEIEMKCSHTQPMQIQVLGC